jgi:hypothetical protein
MPPVNVKEDSVITQSDRIPARTQKLSIAASMKSYAIAGLAAAFIFALIELIDINIRLSPYLGPFSERLILAAYTGMNLAGGLVIGLLVGLFAFAASRLTDKVAKILAGKSEAGWIQSSVAGISVAAISAFLLNQQPTINRYVIGLIREAEKIATVRNTLLSHERATSYLIIMGLVIGCSIVAMITRASARFNPILRWIWIAGLVLSIAVAYYADSRIEVELYEPTLHRSLFLFSFALAMALAATLFLSSSRIQAAGDSSRKNLVLIVAIFITGSLIFTFYNFDRNHNLKTHVLLRSSQTKQFFNLAYWSFDFDRDGYSAILGGGDADDFNRAINPSVKEIAGDGIDNNSIGGDIKTQQVEEWRKEMTSGSAAPVPSAKRLNVLYIFIDALRADHLGVYGYGRNTSPNIDKLAARSVVFENGFTPAPNTYMAMPKFMQSSYWDGHYETWSEVLSRNGYESIIFARRLTTMQRFVKGMKVLSQKKVGKWERTIDNAIKEFQELPKDKPFSMFLYASDPHRPYHYHKDFDFGQSMIDLYDGEIAYTDHHLGRVFDYLEQSDRLKDTIIVLMADHGESLGERGIYKHSSQQYNEQMRVPMIIHNPEIAPRRVSSYASTIDLGVTILSSVGLQVSSDQVGFNLLPLMRGETSEHPPIFGEQAYKQETAYVKPWQAVHPESRKYMIVTQDGYKLIFNRNINSFELYDLKNDPGEFRNLYDWQAEKASELKQKLFQFIDIVQVSRPWDADESKYYFYGGRGDKDDDDDKDL